MLGNVRGEKGRWLRFAFFSIAVLLLLPLACLSFSRSISPPFVLVPTSYVLCKNESRRSFVARQRLHLTLSRRLHLALSRRLLKAGTRSQCHVRMHVLFRCTTSIQFVNSVCFASTVIFFLPIILCYGKMREFFSARVALVTISSICVCYMDIWQSLDKDGRVCGLNASAP